jgi:hypothetical protein
MNPYTRELEELITTVLLPRYIRLAERCGEQVPWTKIPDHLVKAAQTKQHVAWLLKPKP